MTEKTIKQRLKDYLDFAIYLVIAFSIGLLFFSLLPIHDCGYQIANFSCNMWGW